ncbi:hypothetical protein STEG23_027148 [Scotinomys teguina]
MQPDRTTNNGGGTMEVVAAAPRCQLLLIVLMAAMLLPGMKGSPLLVWRKIVKTIKLQGSISKGRYYLVLPYIPVMFSLKFLVTQAVSVKTTSTILNRYGENGKPYLV